MIFSLYRGSSSASQCGNGGHREEMALALLVAGDGGERRWSVPADVPTTLHESQLVLAGSLAPGSVGAARDPSSEDGAEVATIERIYSGWQLTRHSVGIHITVSRAFGGHAVPLPSPGSVALLCHSDTIRFSATAPASCSASAPAGSVELRVELPRTDDSSSSSGEESEELRDDPPAMAKGGGTDDEVPWNGATATSPPA